MDSVRELATKIEKKCMFRFGFDADMCVQLIVEHDLALWTQAQEQMREKVAHRFLEMKQARKGLDYRDYPGEDLNGIKLNDAISEIRALPLDPLPSGEGQEPTGKPRLGPER